MRASHDFTTKCERLCNDLEVASSHSTLKITETQIFMRELKRSRGIQKTLAWIMILTSVGAFVTILTYTVIFGRLLDSLASLAGLEAQPCLTKPLDACGLGTETCSEACCAPPMNCTISPVVGLFCESPTTMCGNCGLESCPDQFRVCRDLANIGSGCENESCKAAYNVVFSALAAVIMLGVCLLIDLYLVLAYYRFNPPVQGVVFLSLVSSLLKWISFGLMMRGDAYRISVMIRGTHCFGDVGQATISSSVSLAISGLILCILSAVIALIHGPAFALAS